MSAQNPPTYEVRHRGVAIPVRRDMRFTRTMQRRGLARFSWLLDKSPVDNETELMDATYFPFDDSLESSGGAVDPVGFSSKSETNYGLVTSGSDLVATKRPHGKFDGAIAIEESTTNLVDPTSDPDTSARINVSQSSKDIYYGQQSWKLTGTNTSAQYAGWKFSTTDGATYTGSVYLYDPNNAIKEVRLYDNNGTGEFANHSQTVHDLGNDLYRVVATGDAEATGTTTHGFLIYVENGTSKEMWVSAPIVEEKAFATSFVDGSRAHGELKYPASAISVEQGSIAMWVYMRDDYPHTTEADTFNRMFGIGESDVTNDLQILTDDEPNPREIRARYTDGDGNRTTIGVSSGNAPVGWNHVVTTWNQSTNTIELYLNGVLIERDASATLPDTFSNVIDGAYFIGTNPVGGSHFNSLVDDLQIYDTVLTSDQISSLANDRTYIGMQVDQKVPFLRVGDEVTYVSNPGSSEQKVFAGLINRVDEQDPTLAPADHTKRLFKFEVSDFERYADRRRVAEVYTSQTADSIVEDIRSTYLDGFGVTGDGIESGPSIQKAVFNYERASTALDELANIAAMQWRINIEKDLQFYSRTKQSPVLTIDHSSRPYQSIRITRHLEEYRNVQYIRGGKDTTSSRTETPSTDGDTKTFVVAYPVAETPTITVNGNAQTVGVRGVDTGKDFYWQEGDEQITQDDGASALASSDNLSITYKGYVPILISSEEVSAIEDRQSVEGGSGIYEDLLTDRNIQSQEQALDKADALLRKFAQVAEEVEFTVIGTDAMASLSPGDLITIDLPHHRLSGDYLIDRITGRDAGNYTLSIKIRALSGESVGGWQNFFRRLQDTQQDFVINENEVLVELRSLVSTFDITDSISISDNSTTLSDTFSLSDSVTVESGSVFHVGDSIGSKIIG